MPPASVPIASIFWLWRSCSSSRRCSVTSRPKLSAAGRPSHGTSTALICTQRASPSGRTTRNVSVSWAPAAPGADPVREQSCGRRGGRTRARRCAEDLLRAPAGDLRVWGLAKVMAPSCSDEDRVPRVLDEEPVLLVALPQRLGRARALRQDPGQNQVEDDRHAQEGVQGEERVVGRSADERAAAQARADGRKDRDGRCGRRGAAHPEAEGRPRSAAAGGRTRMASSGRTRGSRGGVSRRQRRASTNLPGTRAAGGAAVPREDQRRCDDDADRVAQEPGDPRIAEDTPWRDARRREREQPDRGADAPRN